MKLESCSMFDSEGTSREGGRDGRRRKEVQLSSDVSLRGLNQEASFKFLLGIFTPRGVQRDEDRIEK